MFRKSNKKDTPKVCLFYLSAVGLGVDLFLLFIVLSLVFFLVLVLHDDTSRLILAVAMVSLPG